MSVCVCVFRGGTFGREGVLLSVRSWEERISGTICVVTFEAERFKGRTPLFERTVVWNTL